MLFGGFRLLDSSIRILFSAKFIRILVSAEFIKIPFSIESMSGFCIHLQIPNPYPNSRIRILSNSFLNSDSCWMPDPLFSKNESLGLRSWNHLLKKKMDPCIQIILGC